MRLRHVKRHCEQYLEKLNLPSVCDAQMLCAHIARQPNRHGRPIQLLPMPLATDGPCGLWIATAAADYIVFESNTTLPHQNHIIAHELSHLILEHDSHQAFGDGASEQLVPHLDPSMVQRMLGRSRYDAKEEQEAEMMASLLQQRLGQWEPVPTYHVPADVADIVARVSHSLEEGHDP
jgi:hypothetical protein